MRNKIAIAFWFLLIALPCPAQRPQVAILIFDGVQIIDYTGPYEVFGQAGFRVFIVAESKEPITTSMGMQVIPAFTLQDHPEADVIVLPGGRVPHLVPEDSPIINTCRGRNRLLRLEQPSHLIIWWMLTCHFCQPPQIQQALPV